MAATAAPARGTPISSNLPNLNDPAVRAKFVGEAVGGGNPYLPGGPVAASHSSPAPGVPSAAAAAAGAKPMSNVQMVPGFGPITSGYIDAYNASLANARSGINTQLAQALGELGQRRDAAAGIVAGLPGEVAKTAAGSQGALAQANKAALGALGPGSAGQIQVGQGALGSALAGEQSAAASMQPYLGLANMANYQSGAAGLRQQAMQGQQALDADQRQFMSSIIGAQLNNQFQTQRDQRQFEQQKQMMQYQNDLQSQLYAQQQADANAAQYGLKSGSHLDEISQSPAYQYAQLALSQGLYTPGSNSPWENLTGNWSGSNTPAAQPPQQVKQTPQQIIDKYKTSNPDLLRALAANGLLPANLVQAALGLAPAK